MKIKIKTQNMVNPKKNKFTATLCLLLASMSFLVSSLHAGPKKCNGQIIYTKKYGFQASAWNKGTITNKVNCLQKITSGKDKNKHKFTWDWPDYGTTKGRIKAFNYVSLGRKPDNSGYYGNKLPKKVKDLGSFNINSKVRWIKKTGKWNYSINMRLRNGSKVSSPQTAEVHVFENYTIKIPSGNSLGTYTVNGSKYTMRKITNGKGQPYYQAWRQKKRNGGQVDVAKHLNWFVKKSNLNKNHWLSYVRPGCEVWRGKGEVIVDYFVTNGI